MSGLTRRIASIPLFTLCGFNATVSYKTVTLPKDAMFMDFVMANDVLMLYFWYVKEKVIVTRNNNTISFEPKKLYSFLIVNPATDFPNEGVYLKTIIHNGRVFNLFDLTEY